MLRVQTRTSSVLCAQMPRRPVCSVMSRRYGTAVACDRGGGEVSTTSRSSLILPYGTLSAGGTGHGTRKGGAAPGPLRAESGYMSQYGGWVARQMWSTQVAWQ